jgi:hypothetical protein
MVLEAADAALGTDCRYEVIEDAADGSEWLKAVCRWYYLLSEVPYH